MNRHEDAADAARMVGFAMARRKAPARSGEYARLVQRFHTEPDFAQVVRKVAQGFDLTVLEVHPQTGLVLGTTPETDFAVSISELVPQTADRPLYLLAQLTIAAMVFPVPKTSTTTSMSGGSRSGRSMTRSASGPRPSNAVLPTRARTSIRPPVSWGWRDCGGPTCAATPRATPRRRRAEHRRRPPEPW